MDPFSSKRTTLFGPVLLLSLALLWPTSGLAAQEEPQPATTAEPSRQPTYRPGPPPGALRATGDLPAVGEIMMDDQLIAPGALPGRFSCPTGKGLGEFVGEGYIVKVAGRCHDSLQRAFATLPPIPDLVVPDGEIRLDAKVVSGHDRAGVLLQFRSQADPPRGYTLVIGPSQGAALLQKEEGTTGVPLALRTDLAGGLSRDGWNTLAIRLDGPSIWVLVNDELILSASDSMLDRGSVRFGVMRTGNPSDDVESAAVFRNLRVSGLASRP